MKKLRFKKETISQLNIEDTANIYGGVQTNTCLLTIGCPGGSVAADNCYTYETWCDCAGPFTQNYNCDSQDKVCYS
ncbi:MAG: class I lanthipeptide [Hyphomicrobiales bacterium]